MLPLYNYHIQGEGHKVYINIVYTFPVCQYHGKSSETEKNNQLFTLGNGFLFLVL